MYIIRSTVFFIVGLLLLALNAPSKKNRKDFLTNYSSVVQYDSIPSQEEDEKCVIRISSVGDIMAHQTQLTAQMQPDGTYSFDNNFQYMKALFSAADVMIGNLETTFAGEEIGYSAYPRFNTPDALAFAIRNAGINLVATANNHSFDNGGEAMLRTLDILHTQGLETIGTQKTMEEKNYVIREVKGVKIGFASYTYESGKNEEGLKTINGLPVSKKYDPLINSFDPYAPEIDILKMQGIAHKMRADSADFIVFVVHWGKELWILY